MAYTVADRGVAAARRTSARTSRLSHPPLTSHVLAGLGKVLAGKAFILVFVSEAF